MKKINIAELLKDCPTGMELDCTMYDNLSYDYVNEEQNRIYCKVELRDTVWFTIYGCVNLSPNAKCVIFPKGKTTWEGFVPPCKFKDGDVLVHTQNDRFVMSIYKSNESETIINTYTIFWDRGEGLSVGMQICCYTDSTRLATEEEKQKLFDIIKDNGYKWNAETKTLEKLPMFKVGDRIKKGKTIATVVRVCKDFYDIRLDSGGIGSFTINLQDEWEIIPNKFDITTLKPFDKVLVRDNINEKWNIHFFSYIDDAKMFKTIMGTYIQCIPYEGNEHLFETANDCDGYYKTWKQ